ncbi:hypothetical protein FBUS_00957 [Fasciolopsis buskii]|uniref:SAP domain-containing protein n=1 Tax=Fasciolopsis buskii TaxID=27845 RepID=A0A8E0RPS4_9TREM|nr:hypothetical protein FBUS_00957 [Fasciolopsis buski]
MKLSIKELSAELLKNGLRADGATEKTELVDRLMQYHEYSTRTEESLVNNDGNFDARFAQNLLPLALIKSEKQLESLSNAHLRQLLISHPKSAAFRLRHSGLLEQVLTCWRELQGTLFLSIFCNHRNVSFKLFSCVAVEESINNERRIFA